MGSTSTERSRRLRKHRAGDHSLCLPERCPDASAPVATPVASAVAAVASPPPDSPARPYGLRARGRRMWDQLIGDGDPVEVVALVEEICRTADRLDRLDAIVNGRDRAWLTLEVDDVGEVTVVVDKLLGEARQQQMAFKGLLAELRAMRGTSAKQPGRQQGQSAPDGKAVSGVVSLAAEAAKRRAPSAG